LNSTLIECKGISTDLFSLPPFILHKGETIGIYTGNNEPHSAEQDLTAIFTGKTEFKNTIVHKNSYLLIISGSLNGDGYFAQ